MGAAMRYQDIEAGQIDGVLQRMILLADVVAGELDELEMIQGVHERAHTLGPILDPTAYNRGMGNLDQQAELLGPLLTASRKLGPIVARLKEGVPR